MGNVVVLPLGFRIIASYLSTFPALHPIPFPNTHPASFPTCFVVYPYPTPDGCKPYFFVPNLDTSHLDSASRVSASYIPPGSLAHFRQLRGKGKATTLFEHENEHEQTHPQDQPQEHEDDEDGMNEANENIYDDEDVVDTKDVEVHIHRETRTSTGKKSKWWGLT